jgi:hypothetical protein
MTLAVLLMTLSAGVAESATWTLLWDPNSESDIAGYVVYYGTISHQYTTSVDVGNTTSFQFVEPDPTKVYYLAVKAYNIAGLQSPYSAEVSTTPVAQPLTLTGLTSNAPPTPVVGTTITFTTTATGGVAPHQFKWWVFDGTTSTIGKNWSTSNTFAWTPTLPKPGYRITVWARNAASTADNFDNPGATLSTTLAVGASSTVSVTAVSPTSGPTSGGTAVTITGTGFVSGATLKFGTSAATNVLVVSSTSITARTPPHAAGAVSVVVTNPNKQSGTRANGFTYVAPAPTITSVIPNSGSRRGGTSVTITGTGFASGATVSFGGTAATNVTVASSTSITAQSPPHASGVVNVVVTNADKQSGTRTNGFTYVGRPTVTGVTPNSGPTSGGTTVTIRGTNFAAGATVSIGGNPATNVNVLSTTTITAKTPAHGARTVTVRVTNPDGQWGRRTNSFSYTAPSSPPN